MNNININRKNINVDMNPKKEKTSFPDWNKLQLQSFGGVDNVTKNMFVYENKDDILVVDCGVGFPDEPEKSGEEELLLPDFTYLLKNRDKVRGLVVTHAHFDHYGAVPELLKKINVPVYCSRLTQEFIKGKATDSGLKPNSIDFQVLKSTDNGVKIGGFELIPFHINHSIPESLGLFIKTSLGNIFHVADYKFDWTPVDEGPFDIQKASRLAALDKPLLLLSDCLGAAKAGHTDSETAIQEVLENIIIRAKGMVLITTISSNISRIKQAIQASANVGRKVAFLGRSLEQSSEIARKLGYLGKLKNFVIPPGKIKKQPFDKLTLIVAGSYGQSDSALQRIAQGKHNLVKLKPKDTVIFSADPAPPGVRVAVNKMIDNLTRIGARVFYYEIQENLHVSGHGTAEDIKMLMAIVRPHYLMPIGGDFRHMRAYQELAAKMGYPEDKVIFLKEKQAIKFSPNKRLVVQ